MSFLPESYDSPIDLPFNQASLEKSLTFSAPDHDPGGPGFWLILQAGKLMVKKEAGQTMLPFGEQPPLPPADNFTPVYLGEWQEQPCRLLPVSGDVQRPEPLDAESLLAREPQLPLELLSLGGLGRMVLHWEKVSKHCGNCGVLMKRLPGNWGKKCPGCSAVHFPRIHPCIIVLIRRGDEFLLVRKPEWLEKRYGLVAGFVDFGENLEETVIREVREEVGLEVENIRYVGSQCWPFPSQLMTGFTADYLSGEIVLVDQELAEADWYHKDRLPTLPPQRSIARYLIDAAVHSLT
ncbi:MAG TPA: NAD(+) diphosphatase [Geopsychrobacteraceae bacterium]|nr:NAD(+) diphosphatase [Geopsychrobacteraceae bacterium]